MRSNTTYPESMFSSLGLIFSALEGCLKAGSINKITEVMLAHLRISFLVKYVQSCKYNLNSM